MYYWREKEGDFLSLIKSTNILLRGPRQAGKTTLLKEMAKRLNAYYYTLDEPNTLFIFERDPSSLVKGDVVFIDEIQESPNAGRVLRYLTDHFADVRFVFSGSGAFDIKYSISSYLVGRVRPLLLLPLSFKEFVKWRSPALFDWYSKYCGMFYSFLEGGPFPSASPLPALEPLFREYVLYGGFPKVVLSEDKEAELRSLVDFMIDKDVVRFFGLRNREKLWTVLKNLAYRSGKLLDYSSLGVDYKTAVHYVSILQGNHLIELLPSYSKNPSVELRKAKKVVFYDSGFRRSLIPLESGFVLEEFVFRQLLPSFYWRDRHKHEVDFIYKGIPVEVKKGGKVGRGFYAYLRYYAPKRAVILHLSWEVKEERYRETTVLHWPIYLL